MYVPLRCCLLCVKDEALDIWVHHRQPVNPSSSSLREVCHQNVGLHCQAILMRRLVDINLETQRAIAS